MVKKISIFFGFTLFFIYSLIYFTPKQSVYYLAEHKLKDYGVIVSKEKVHDSGFALHINNANIFIKGISSAVAKKTKIMCLLFYNSVIVKNITLLSVAKNFIPLHIKSVYIHYSIINPINVMLNANGEFGSAFGSVNLLKRVIVIHLLPSKKMLRNYHSTLNMLKKDKNGGFVYEQSF